MTACFGGSQTTNRHLLRGCNEQSLSLDFIFCLLAYWIEGDSTQKYDFFLHFSVRFIEQIFHAKVESGLLFYL